MSDSRCLEIFHQKVGSRSRIQPETWPQDPVKFNRILGRYKASKDAAAPGFLKRRFHLSDFYEAKMKKDADSDDGDHSDDGDDSDDGDGSDDDDGDDNDHVDPKLQKSSNAYISENKYPTWDARIDLFSKDELIKFIASLEAKIQASTLEIGKILCCETKSKFIPNSLKLKKNTAMLEPRVF
ncbi:hypothetical protein EV2_045610 [Malus domestica]